MNIAQSDHQMVELNINAQCGQSASTALHKAVADGSVRITQLLLANGADVTLRDRLVHTLISTYAH